VKLTQVKALTDEIWVAIFFCFCPLSSLSSFLYQESLRKLLKSSSLMCDLRYEYRSIKIWTHPNQILKIHWQILINMTWFEVWTYQTIRYKHHLIFQIWIFLYRRYEHPSAEDMDTPLHKIWTSNCNVYEHLFVEGTNTQIQ
jgi:hypothetical protein